MKRFMASLLFFAIISSSLMRTLNLYFHEGGLIKMFNFAVLLICFGVGLMIISIHNDK